MGLPQNHRGSLEVLPHWKYIFFYLSDQSSSFQSHKDKKTMMALQMYNILKLKHIVKTTIPWSFVEEQGKKKDSFFFWIWHLSCFCFSSFIVRDVYKPSALVCCGEGTCSYRNVWQMGSAQGIWGQRITDCSYII